MVVNFPYDCEQCVIVGNNVRTGREKMKLEIEEKSGRKRCKEFGVSRKGYQEQYSGVCRGNLSKYLGIYKKVGSLKLKMIEVYKETDK